MDPVSKAQNVANNEKATRKPGGVTGKGFMPGRSGNPSGRPKKLHITKMYEKILNKASNRKEIEASIMKVLTGGRMSTVLMAREMAERTEGKVADVVDMNVTGTVQLASVIEERRKKRGNADSRQS